MHLRLFDLDGGVLLQPGVCRRRPGIVPLQSWGPNIRLACGFRRFARFEQALTERLGTPTDVEPTLTFIGSGDFHHVSLALLRRQHAEPFNLLVLDTHPDWMRGLPMLHCGTWLEHASRLPHVQRIFHLGGDIDFDNYYRPLAPWPLLRSGRLVVFPAVRQFQGKAWSGVAQVPLRTPRYAPLRPTQLRKALAPYATELAVRPLYISLDKDVLVRPDAVVNWESGHLSLGEVQDILAIFLDAARGALLGMDIVGDWSPVRVNGLLRNIFHHSMHPALPIDPDEANAINDQTSLSLLDSVQASLGQTPLLRRAV